MKQNENNPIHWVADDGKAFIRKADGAVMGKEVYLHEYVDGTEDVIDNYEEIEMIWEEED